MKHPSLLTAACVAAFAAALFAAHGAQAATTVRALDASAGPGGTQTVDVVLEVTPLPGWELNNYDIFLDFDTGVLVQPTDLDITKGPIFDGLTVIFAANTTVEGEVRVGLIFFFPSDSIVIANPSTVLFSVAFDVQGSPLSPSSYLSITGVYIENEVSQSVGATAGPDGTFTVTEHIRPFDPYVSVGEWLHLVVMPTPTPAPVWSFQTSGSGGTIDDTNGLYHAGLSAVDDVVMASVGGDTMTADVTVSATPRPSGQVGPPTSMDIDGEGLAIGDVIQILRFVVALDIPTQQQEAAADFNYNGSVDISDVVNSLRVAVGLPPSV